MSVRETPLVRGEEGGWGARGRVPRGKLGRPQARRRNWGEAAAGRGDGKLQRRRAAVHTEMLCSLTHCSFGAHEFFSQTGLEFQIPGWLAQAFGFYLLPANIPSPGARDEVQ